MRIERFQIRSPGTGRVFDSGDRPLGRLVLVHGGGDAGEAIATEFLGSLMLGVVEATTHGSTASTTNGLCSDGIRSGTIELRTHDGSSLAVSRAEDGAVETPNGRTPALPSPHVFRLIFAPSDETQPRWTLADWSRVGPAATSGVDDASRTELGSRLRRDVDPIAPPTLARARDQLREFEAERNQVRTQRAAARKGLQRMAQLWPVHYQLRLVARWRRDAGPLEELFGLPFDPAAQLAQLEHRAAELDEELDRLGAARRQAQEVMRSIRDVDRVVLDREADFERVLHDLATVPTLETEQRGLEAKKTRANRELSALRRATFETEIAEDRLAALDIDSLGRRLADLGRARSELDGLQREFTRHRRAAPDDPPAFPLIAVVFLACGAGSLGLSFDSGNQLLSAVGYTFSWIALLFVAAWWSRVRRVREECDVHVAGESALGEEVTRAGANVEARSDDIDERLAHLPVRRELLQHSPPVLVGRLQETRTALLDRDRTAATIRQVRRRIDRAREGVTRVWSDVFVRRELSATLEERSSTLRSAVIEAHRRRVTVDRARIEAQQLEQLCLPLEQRRDDGLEAHRKLSQRLTEIGDGDPAAGCRAVASRYRSVHAAEWLEGRLREELIDCAEVESELVDLRGSFGPWIEGDDLMVGLSHLTADLDDTLAEFDHSIRRTRADIELLQAEAIGSETMPSSDAIASLEAQLDRLEQQREELRNIDTLIEDADRNFAEDEQPAIVERANQHLGRIAGADCKDPPVIEIEEKTRLHVRSSDDRSVGPALLALRLALAERFDDDGERTPIFLRESFGTWPQDQRCRVWDLLREYSSNRQVFVFADSPGSFGLPAEPGLRSDRVIALRPKTDPPAAPLARLRGAFTHRFGDLAGRVRELLARPTCCSERGAGES